MVVLRMKEASSYEIRSKTFDFVIDDVIKMIGYKSGSYKKQ